MSATKVDNLWMETGVEERDRLNVVKSWLCNSTCGDTSSIHERVMRDWQGRVLAKGYVPEFAGSMSILFNRILPVETDMKVDDPETERRAKELLDLIYELEDEVSEHPERYFNRVPETGLKCGAGDDGKGCMFRNALSECEKPGPCPYAFRLDDNEDEPEAKEDKEDKEDEKE